MEPNSKIVGGSHTNVPLDEKAPTNPDDAAAAEAKQPEMELGMKPNPTAEMIVSQTSFEKIMGIPPGFDKGEYQASPSWVFCLPTVGDNPTRETSLYYTLVDEERVSRFFYRLVDSLVYVCSMSQLPPPRPVLLLF